MLRYNNEIFRKPIVHFTQIKRKPIIGIKANKFFTSNEADKCVTVLLKMLIVAQLRKKFSISMDP
jgi:hypothetical protein